MCYQLLAQQAPKSLRVTCPQDVTFPPVCFRARRVHLSLMRISGYDLLSDPPRSPCRRPLTPRRNTCPCPAVINEASAPPCATSCVTFTQTAEAREPPPMQLEPAARPWSPAPPRAESPLRQPHDAARAAAPATPNPSPRPCSRSRLRAVPSATQMHNIGSKTGTRSETMTQPISRDS